MAISDWTSTRYAGSVTNQTHTYGTAAEGDVILITVWRSNAGTSGAQNHATASGFTEVGHHDPTTTWRMIGTTLAKEAGASEPTSVNLDWTATDGESNQVITSAIIPAADISSFVVAFQENSSTNWTFPSDSGSLANNIHTAATQRNTDISSLLYPSGDTNITHSVINWRNGGISLSGGNTAASTFPISNAGVAATISWDDAATGPTTSVSSFADGAKVTPEALSDFDVAVSGITGTCTSVNYQLVRDSDGYYWNFAGSWVAGVNTYGATVSETSGFTQNFTNGPTTLTEGAAYTLQTQALDTAGTSAFVDRTFTVGTWEYTDPITVYANALPVVTTCTGLEVDQVLNPLQPLPSFTFTTTASDNDIKGVHFRLKDVTDNTFWNATTGAWQGGAAFNYGPTGTNTSPYNYTFEHNVDSILLPQTLPIDHTFQLAAWPRDNVTTTWGTGIEVYSFYTDVAWCQAGVVLRSGMVP